MGSTLAELEFLLDPQKQNLNSDRKVYFSAYKDHLGKPDKLQIFGSNVKYTDSEGVRTSRRIYISNTSGASPLDTWARFSERHGRGCRLGHVNSRTSESNVHRDKRYGSTVYILSK